MKHFIKKFTLFILFLTPLTLQAHEALGPFPVQTQNPLYLLFHDEVLESAEIKPSPHKLNFSFSSSFSNLLEKNASATTALDLDMEVLRLGLEGRYQINPSLEAGAEMSFLSFQGGFLDSFVQGYHNAFGFPNGGRDLVRNGRYSYTVSKGGAVIYTVPQQNFGISNITLFSKLAFWKESHLKPALAAKASIKIPVGGASKGLSSNRPDFGFSLLAEKSFFTRIHTVTQLGFVVIGGHPQLKPILRKGALSFAQSVEVNLAKNVSAVAQINGNSSYFRNVDIPELSSTVLDMTLGVTGVIPFKDSKQNLRYMVGFAEDPLTDDASVDFTVFGKLGWDF